MLELLRIKDLALIEDLEMEFSGGMNVLTGETGAGKTFILKSLDFITGEKLDTDMVRPGKEKAVAEALFVLDGEELILRRELVAETGRSRLYVNGDLSSREAVKDLRPALLLHVGQHGRQKLLQPAFQAEILDDFMNRPDLIDERSEALKKLNAVKARQRGLEEQYSQLKEKRDVLEYQQQEISKVNPKPGEEEELEQSRRHLRQMADTANLFEGAMTALYGQADEAGLISALDCLLRNLNQLSAIDDDFTDHHAKLEDMRYLLRDLESSLRKISTSKAPGRDVEQIESRLYALAQLKRKLKRDLPSILNLRQEIEDNLAFLDNCELQRKDLERELSTAREHLAQILARLNPARQAAALELSSALERELKDLGFSDQLRVFFEFTPALLSPGCEDLAELKPALAWQPNPGQPPQPLDKIASGGELSRFLLGLVSMISSRSTENPLLIFDEVDSGVGGLTLNHVADKLESLAAKRQMLLITHWPQLAARGNRHFLVKKEVLANETYTRCARLDQAQVQAELTRMAGGEGHLAQRVKG